MKKLNILILNFIIVSLIMSCSGKTNSVKNDDETKILIKTQYGNMVVKLYNETPKHRDNFIKLVKEGYYDNLLFHRVIKNFMIQGGDPDSKDSPVGKALGNGDPGYMVDAEIVDGLYHKKGALAAARMPDKTNPEKKSSGSQFYIVQGKVWTPENLKQLEEKQKFKAVHTETMKIYKEKKSEIRRLKREGKLDSINNLKIQIEEMAESSVDTATYKLNKTRSEIYTTIGGTPHLDGDYTVFGEVVEGLSIIDSIAKVETDRRNRPIKNIKMEMELIE